MVTNKTFEEISVGDTAQISRTLSKKEINLFGMLSGDMNPTHFSDEYAKFLMEREKRCGHSMWGGTLISGLLGNDLPGPGTVYKSQNLEFLGPVELGDTLTVKITVKEKSTETKDIIFDCRATNQRGETIIQGMARVQAPKVKPSEHDGEFADFRVRTMNVFEKFIHKCTELEPITVAVCHPCSPDALAGAVEAAERELIVPVLVGPEEKIQSVAKAAGIDIGPYRIVNTAHSNDSARAAVALCRSGETAALMKGSLHTDELMHEVARKETGLRTAKRISHIFIMDVPTYSRPFLITDAANNNFPTQETKVVIVTNSIELAHALGIALPKVAILSAVETIYPKIPSTLEAAALCKMVDRGQITGAIVDGPLAFDNAVSKEAALIKGIDSPVAGETDIFVVPDLEAGNMLAKQLTYLTGADSAGMVMGARVPIILTSRADSAKARLASCAVAVALAHARRTGKPAFEGIRS
jgi:phosphate acetyltransferase